MSGLTTWDNGERRDEVAARGLTRSTGPAARFANDAEILSPRWRYVPKDPTLLIGHHLGQLIGLANDDRHALTVAGSRGGKGISLVVPNLVLWPGSALVLDPKGELARKTARARRQVHKQDVIVLDPFGVSGQPPSTCNLLDGIDLHAPNVVADLQLLLESLIVDSNSQSNGSHWTGGARELVLALCLFAKIHFHRPTLVTVFEILGGRHGTIMGSIKEPSEVFGVLLETPDLNGALRAMAIRFLEIPPEEQGSIVSTARRQLAWLEGLNNPDAAMAKVCQPSDFSLPDLKRRDVTVYLCLPASYMHAYRPWLRSFVNLAMSALENTPSRPGAPPVLLMLDEFATLGYMASLEKAAGLLAGAGVRMWPIVQDLGQLESIYGKRWGTFIGNAGVTTWHALGGDAMTADYLSQRLGTTQYYEPETPSGTFADRASGGMLTGGGRWVTDRMAHPHELERGLARETGQLLALSPGSPPLLLQRNDITRGFLREYVDE